MQAPVLHQLCGQRLWLSGSRALFWEEESILLLSDLHLGKSGHFRKEGIAVPGAVMKEDMQRLLEVLQFFRPKKLVVVGDLFHSRANIELDLFLRWRTDIAHQPILLVKGNHDVLSDDFYQSAGIEIQTQPLLLGPFGFAHDPADAPAGSYTFCGHLHPGILLSGLARQSLRLPCFYFTSGYCILPAFGRFTGLATLPPGKAQSVFAVAEEKVMKII